MDTTLLAVYPSQFLGIFPCFHIPLIISKTLFLISPPFTNWFVPSQIVTGRSVFSLTVKHGIFKYVASSCIPPESVRTKAEFFNKLIISEP